jgi:hypothetical protein
MWLKELLPHDLPNARILTYGYDADTRSFTHTSTQNIFRHAEAFVTDLTQQRKETPEVGRVGTSGEIAPKFEIYRGRSYSWHIA